MDLLPLVKQHIATSPFATVCFTGGAGGGRVQGVRLGDAGGLGGKECSNSVPLTKTLQKQKKSLTLTPPGRLLQTGAHPDTPSLPPPRPLQATAWEAAWAPR